MCSPTGAWMDKSELCIHGALSSHKQGEQRGCTGERSTKGSEPTKGHVSRVKVSRKGHSVGMIRHSHRLRERGRKTHCFGPFTVDKSGNSVDNIHIINGINKGIQQV